MKVLNVMFWQYGTCEGYAKIAKIDMDMDFKYRFFSFTDIMENSSESRIFWKTYNSMINQYGEFPLGDDDEPDESKGKKVSLQLPEFQELFNKETDLEIEKMSISVSDLKEVSYEEMKEMAWIFEYLPPRKVEKEPEDDGERDRADS